MISSVASVKQRHSLFMKSAAVWYQGYALPHQLAVSFVVCNCIHYVLVLHWIKRRDMKIPLSLFCSILRAK